MIRFKYQLNDGYQPHTAIQQAIPEINLQTQVFLGEWPSGDWLYGEVDADASYQSALESSMSGWQPTFFSDAEALSYLDALIPAGTVLRTKITADAAEINTSTGRLEKPYTES